MVLVAPWVRPAQFVITHTQSESIQMQPAKNFQNKNGETIEKMILNTLCTNEITLCTT